MIIKPIQSSEAQNRKECHIILTKLHYLYNEGL